MADVENAQLPGPLRDGVRHGIGVLKHPIRAFQNIGRETEGLEIGPRDGPSESVPPGAVRLSNIYNKGKQSKEVKFRMLNVLL